jgi:hypothetical protein
MSPNLDHREPRIADNQQTLAKHSFGKVGRDTGSPAEIHRAKPESYGSKIFEGLGVRVRATGLRSTASSALGRAGAVADAAPAASIFRLSASATPVFAMPHLNYAFPHA